METLEACETEVGVVLYRSIASNARRGRLTEEEKNEEKEKKRFEEET